MPWDVLVASLASGTFALLGVGLSNLTAVRREQATFATQTALELADMERHIWKQDWIELQIQLERLGARLAVSGVPEDLMQAFHDISVACWRDQTPVLDPDDREQISIARDLLDGRRVVQRAIRAYLLPSQRGDAHRLRDDAINTTAALRSEREHPWT
jgi:hypothetical protein